MRFSQILVLFCASYFVGAKPADSGHGNTRLSSGKLSSSKSSTDPRRVISSWNNGEWQASARLPSSSRSGGNEHSRYRISRDGSLSLSLNSHTTNPTNNTPRNFTSESPSDPKLIITIDKDDRDPRPNAYDYSSPFNQFHYNNGNNELSPSELRSFSVVLSDVEVVGNYENSGLFKPMDSYAKAGVKSYSIHSNSIHRMNASWKLNSQSASPTTKQLVKFLSLFTNEESPRNNGNNNNEDKDSEFKDLKQPTPSDTTAMPDSQLQNNQTLINDYYEGSEQIGKDANHYKNQFNNTSKVGSDPDLSSFATWTENPSRVLVNDYNNVSFNHQDDSTKPILAKPHSIEKFNGSLGVQREPNRHRRMRRQLKKQFAEKSMGNYSVSTSKIDGEEEGGKLNQKDSQSEEQEKYFKPSSDPQQPDNDLKKLISMVMKADGEKQNKSGTDIVNVLVNPNVNDKNKILFLKSPQIQNLLKSLTPLTSQHPILQQLTGAFETQASNNNNNNGDYIRKGVNQNQDRYHLNSVTGDSDSSTPDGFPLTGSGYLNLHHPNLQFHQALHHLVANGTTPTSINAVTRTNIINIFVLNFNDSQPHNYNSHITPKPYKVTSLFHGIKPVLLEDVRPNVPAHLQMLNKLMNTPQFEDYGLKGTTAPMNQVTPSPFHRTSPFRRRPLIKSYKSTANPFISSTQMMAGSTTPAPDTFDDKINILGLLPSEVDKITDIHYGSSEVNGSFNDQGENSFFSDFLPDKSRDPNTMMSHPVHYMRPRPKPQGSHSDILAYLKSTTPATTPNPLPPELSHLSWIFQAHQNTPSEYEPDVSESEINQTMLDNKKVTVPGDSIEYENDNQNYDNEDPDFTDVDSYGDSMMEAEETSRHPMFQDYDSNLMNNSVLTSSPDILQAIEKFLTKDNQGRRGNETAELGQNEDTAFLNEQEEDFPSSTTEEHTMTESVDDENETNDPLITNTTTSEKPPAFSIHGVKVPEKVSSTTYQPPPHTLRRIFTALGYSTLPTIAAGAAATWPFWVPLLGKKKRRRKREMLLQQRRTGTSTKDLTHGQTADFIDTGRRRNNRRLHKWDKTEPLSDEHENEGNDGSNLAQSLNSMASHLLDKIDDSLENSAEKDIFLNGNKNNDDGSSTDQNGTEETSSDEETSPTGNPKATSVTWHDGGGEEEDDDPMAEKQKSDGTPTTPKGLTTWSAVNGGSGAYIKGSVEKIPNDFTVSSAISFNTDRPIVTVDLTVKEKTTSNSSSTTGTTELPRTTKTNLVTPVPLMVNNKRRRPYHKNKKVVLPSKFVKPPLEDVTAEAVGTDATHTIYKTKVETKITSPMYSTRKPPLWPYQMPVKKVVTTKPPFSRITSKPKYPYAQTKKPQTPFNSVTTTTPSTTTVYIRNPVVQMPTISFTNLGFMDFLRSQIIPRIGLSLISFMAASPLILSMLGASAIGRRKRSLDSPADNDAVQFEYIKNPDFKDLPKFDFSTIKKKWSKMDLIRQKSNERQTVWRQVTDYITHIMNSQMFSSLRSKLFQKREILSPNGSRRKHP